MILPSRKDIIFYFEFLTKEKIKLSIWTWLLVNQLQWGGGFISSPHMNVVQCDHSHVHFSRESYIRKWHLEEVSVVIVEENYITRKIVFDKKVL